MITRTTIIWFLVGGIWNSTNLWLLHLVIKNTFSQSRKMGRIMLILFLKFPILYTSGYLILTYEKPSFGGLILGFSIPLLATLIWLIRRSTRPTQPDHTNDAKAKEADYSGIIHNMKGQQG
ncbi:MAG TPA: hypothetical protein VI387_08335 [Candidatus Brocadiales bacterium]|nr:hypothetical protein [Candidatus Brocadiales bacterium]